MSSPEIRPSHNSAIQPHGLRYRPDIDGLRAIAVLAVVLFHAFPSLINGGFVGVDVFFVISGFLISSILFQEFDKASFSFSGFYARRIRRIFPALIAVLVACFIAGWFILLADEYKQLGKHMAAGAGFVSNFALWSETGYFDTEAETKPLLHLWSLGIEEQFYLVWPLLLWAIWKWRLRTGRIVLLFMIASFLLNIAFVYRYPTETFYLPMSRFWELLAGGLFAWFLKHPEDLPQFLGQSIFAKAMLLREAAGWAGALLLILALGLMTKDGPFPGWWAVLPVAGAVLILSAGQNTYFNRVFLSNRVAVWFGHISYPLYLWHWPVLTFARLSVGDVPSWQVRAVLVLVCIGLAWLTAQIIEKPLRFGRNGARKAVALASFMIVVACVGVYTNKRNGFEFRNVGTVTKLFNKNVAEVAVLNHFELPHPSCIKLTGVEHARDWCTESKVPDSDPDVLLIGDSYSGAYAPMFEHLFSMGEGKHHVFRQYARGACPSLVGYGGEYCVEITQKIVEYVRQTSSIKTVFLAANWPGYYVGDPAAIEMALKQTVMLYRSLGKHVVVLLSPPNGAKPKSCVIRNIAKGTRFCDLTMETAQGFDANYRERFVPLLQSLQISLFDPFKYLCDSATCKVIDGPRILYYDPGHISTYGAEFLAKHAKDDLFGLISVPGAAVGNNKIREEIKKRSSQDI